MSQADFAKELGVSRSLIAKIESGRATPTSDLLERAAAATGTARFAENVPTGTPPVFRRRAIYRQVIAAAAIVYCLVGAFVLTGLLSRHGIRPVLTLLGEIVTDAGQWLRSGTEA